MLALEGLLQVPEHKARVVDILRPIYERADDWRHLVAVNDERLALANDDGGTHRHPARDRAALGGARRRPAGARSTRCARAWTLDPDDGDAREQLDRLAERDQALGRPGGRVRDGASPRPTDSPSASSSRRSRSSTTSSATIRGARSTRGTASSRSTRPSSQPLEEMDSLATLLSDWPTLVRVLTRKAELVPDDETRASTWRRVGEARRDMLDDVRGAIDAYERALELEPASAFTIDHLIALYEQKNDAARLVDLYRRRVELCGEDDGGLKFQLLARGGNAVRDRPGGPARGDREPRRRRSTCARATPRCCGGWTRSTRRSASGRSCSRT